MAFSFPSGMYGSGWTSALIVTAAEEVVGALFELGEDIGLRFSVDVVEAVNGGMVADLELDEDVGLESLCTSFGGAAGAVLKDMLLCAVCCPVLCDEVVWPVRDDGLAVTFCDEFMGVTLILGRLTGAERSLELALPCTLR